jgi:hypothetical protein
MRVMSRPEEISEDRGFKALITSYPVEAIEVFVPELLAERGKPATISVIQQESTLPDLGEPNRFVDVALLATWDDGSQAVILLVEHWSQARKVELRRVNWYVADLALRHPLAMVYPVVLVTDPGCWTIPNLLTMTVVGKTTLALWVQVYRVSAAELPRLRLLQNRVAAILMILPMRDAVNAVDVVVSALELMARSPGPLEDLERFLPFAMKLAKMQKSDMPRFKHRLKEAGMINVLTEMREAAEAKGRTKGRTEGRTEGRAEGRTEALSQSSQATVASFKRLMDRGIITHEAARAQLQELMNSGAITIEIGQEALSQLT